MRGEICVWTEATETSTKYELVHGDEVAVTFLSSSHRFGGYLGKVTLGSFTVRLDLNSWSFQKSPS